MISNQFNKLSIPFKIAFSFLIVIIVGSILLSLPISQISTSEATYFDHLFTAVSMVCVTGLYTQPVYLTYNLFGQIVCILLDRKSTRLNSSHVSISYAVFCLKKKTKNHEI